MAAEKPPERPFHYELDRRIASGGMGEVFLARDKSTGKVCVIKRMLPNLMSDQQFVTMFLDEARLVAQLNHPNIAPLYDFGMGGGVLYLSMEYVPGANLRVIVKDHAQRKAQISFDAAARILSQAALALDYAHLAKAVDGKPLKLIHRDVSPQNILLSTAGVVKLIDFGVAKATTASQQTAAGLVKGKYAYMSPEQLRGHALDGRSDVYGLGLVLYELLALERAIPGKTDAEVAQNALRMKFAPIETRRADVPERLRAILTRALSKDAKDRYGRAADFSSDLERFLADRRVSPTSHELAALLPKSVAPAPGAAPAVPWEEPAPPPKPAPPPTASTPAFWENHVGPPTDASTDEELPPTQQLTPSQLPVKGKQVDASEAPTAFIDDVKLPPPPPPKRASRPTPQPSPQPPPPPLEPKPHSPSPAPAPPAFSQSALSAAIRRGMLPWVLSAAVLLFGAAALVFGFLLLNRHPAPRQDPASQLLAPPPTPSPPEPAPSAPPAAPAPPVPDAPIGAVASGPSPAPVAPGPASGPAPSGEGHAPAQEGAPPAPPQAPAAIDSAIISVVSAIPAKVSVDGAANGRVPVEVSVSPGPHTLVFEDLATGLKHKRVVNLNPGDRRKEAWNPERGRLVVRASPWAEIFVGDHSFGVTPLDAIEVVAGRHQFRFVNTDTKRTVQRVVDVPPNRETLVKVDLR